MMQEKTSFDANYSLEGEFVVVDHLERCRDQNSQDYPYGIRLDVFIVKYASKINQRKFF